MNATAELKLSYTGPDRGLHYWLLIDGIPVAYAKIYEDSYLGAKIVELCDIETREGYRNRGHATELLRSIAATHGVDSVSHSGGYTPDGFSFIAGKLNRIGNPEKGPSYQPMGFVHSWDELQPKYC